MEDENVSSEEILDQPTVGSEKRNPGHTPDFQFQPGSQPSRRTQGFPQSRPEGVAQGGAQGLP